MNTTASGEMRERILKSFMDLMILKELRKNVRISGYDIIVLFHRRFHLLLSPGSVYSVLYALERKGLVVGTMTGDKRIYKISKKGEEVVQSVLRNTSSIQLFMESLFCR
jgi:DNA-binding PadR family transcriptional regulator